MMEGGLYLHIPFCKNKCLYCDFYSGGQRIANWPLYVNCILNEIQSRKKEFNFPLSSLYLGGGTPSLIPASEFLYLIEKIGNLTGTRYWKEFTLEVNPDDVSPEMIGAWKEAGVNRISIGIQSLINSELAAIGRRHDTATAIKALSLIKDSFKNFSVDVMYGLPGQTVDSYKETLNRIFDYRPPHISAYSLMLEEGTALSLLVKQNKISLPEETEWLKMYEISNTLLNRHGYEKYEISNYALPGMASKHNSLYWTGNPYIGLGPGAHSYDGINKRKANPTDIKSYLKFFSDTSSLSHDKTFYSEEILSENELQEEMIMTRLRTVKGLNLDEYSKAFGNEKKENLLHKVHNHIAKGFMKEISENVSLTSKGFLIYNSIVADLI